MAFRGTLVFVQSETLYPGASRSLYMSHADPFYLTNTCVRGIALGTSHTDVSLPHNRHRESGRSASSTNHRTRPSELSCLGYAFCLSFLAFLDWLFKKKKKSFPSDVLSAQNHYLFCTKRKLPEDRGLRLLCPRAQPKP